jgi:plasmid stability protein
MSNITLNVPDDVLHNAKVIAAEQRTSVNALVRAYLVQLSNQRTKVKAAMAELREMSETTEARLGPDFKWNRDSLYDR